MATVRSPPNYPKSKSAQRSHYHESFVEKKGPQDPDYKKFWAGLHGLTIYFYNNNRDIQHVEKLDLGTFMKLTDEPPRRSIRDSSIYFSLVLRNQVIKFKVENVESREMWKGFILTVVELQVPRNLTLLPGHLHMMAEALTKEEERRSQEMPACFLDVNRLEAQMLLERFPDCGNLLLRPCGDGSGGVSVTTRQIFNGSPKVLHYKVNLGGPKYVIDVEPPHYCSSLDSVVSYFVQRSNKSLLPFMLDEDYEKVLGYPEANNENGESEWVTSSATRAPNPGPPPPPLSSLPRQTPAPSSSLDRPFLLPPPRNPEAEKDYVIPIADGEDHSYVNEDASSPSRPVVAHPRNLAKATPPPTMPKPVRRGFKAIPGVTHALFPKTDLSKELEVKLQKRLERLAQNS